MCVSVRDSENDPRQSSLVRFTLPSLPANSVVTGATLGLYYVGSNFENKDESLTLALYAIQPSLSWPRDWVEGGGSEDSTNCTWKQYKTGYSWQADGCEDTYYDRNATADITDTFGYYDLFGYRYYDVTSRVLSWYNGTQADEGWLIRGIGHVGGAVENEVQFSTKEYQPSWESTLSVTYYVIPEPSSLTALAGGIVGLLGMRRRKAS